MNIASNTVAANSRSYIRIRGQFRFRRTYCPPDILDAIRESDSYLLCAYHTLDTCQPRSLSRDNSESGRYAEQKGPDRIQPVRELPFHNALPRRTISNFSQRRCRTLTIMLVRAILTQEEITGIPTRSWMDRGLILGEKCPLSKAGIGRNELSLLVLVGTSCSNHP